MARKALTITAQDGLARTGRVQTAHGAFLTPAFMPVATHGAVKAVPVTKLPALGIDILLSNTYHLYLHPGHEKINEWGGLHQFMGWNKPILTDSGGFQVFSLGHRTGGVMAKLDDRGVTFVSHRDGNKHRFTPKKVIDIQQALGVDIMMPLDDCPPAEGTAAVKKAALERTHRWLGEAVEYWQSNPGKQLLFGITQGGTDKRMRLESIKTVAALPVSGVALGGLAVGEGKKALYETISWAAPALPSDRPRYLMGVGYPQDLLWAVGWGIDMFDCVIPTRLARHGSVWVLEGNKAAIKAFYEQDTAKLLSQGEPLNIVRRTFPKSQYAGDHNPLQAEASTPLDGLTGTYANHLAKEKEIGLMVQFSEQNLLILQLLLQHARAAIASGDYLRYAALFGVHLPK